jgi:CelD/BcsL family acetyltransferase involved in cellulose biosynthesis
MAPARKIGGNRHYHGGIAASLCGLSKGMRMRVTVVRPGDLGPSEASLWATFQQFSPTTPNPFLSLTFARVAVVETDDCRGLLSVLSAGERAVALFFGLIAHGGLSSWFLTYDRELSRYSPGRMMWQPLAEEAACRGITRLDLGYGQDQYKFGLADASYLVVGGAAGLTGASRRYAASTDGRTGEPPVFSGGAESERGDMAQLTKTAW